MSESGFTEVIVFREDKYQIKRTYSHIDPKTRQLVVIKAVEYIPLDSMPSTSPWYATKSVTATVLIRHETEDLDDIENLVKAVFYEQTIDFDVIDSPISKPIYLKTEQTRKILSQALEQYEVYRMVYIKNLDTGQLNVAVTENSEGFPYSVVKVTKSKPKRVKFERAKELLDSGTVYGIFADKDLKLRLC